MSGSDEKDDFCTGEPAVGQHLVEMNLALDDATYHPNHQGNLALVILFDALCGMGVRCMFLGETRIKLLLLQTVVALLAFLSDNGEVEQHLADAVSDTDEQALEAEHHRVSDMRVYLADKLSLDTTGVACLIRYYNRKVS